MTAAEIEKQLRDEGIETEGVVSYNRTRTFYAVGYLADDLPDDINGYTPVDDPSLTGEF